MKEDTVPTLESMIDTCINDNLKFSSHISYVIAKIEYKLKILRNLLQQHEHCESVFSLPNDVTCTANYRKPSIPKLSALMNTNTNYSVFPICVIKFLIN